MKLKRETLAYAFKIYSEQKKESRRDSLDILKGVSVKMFKTDQTKGILC